MKIGSILGLGAGALAGSVLLETYYLKDGFAVSKSTDPNAKGADCSNGNVCGPKLHCSSTGLFQQQCIDTSFEVKRAAIGAAFVGGGALLGYWLGGKL